MKTLLPIKPHAPAWKYTVAAKTDIRKTFREAIRKQEQSNVTPMRKKEVA